jgi:hypothetical protein
MALRQFSPALSGCLLRFNHTGSSFEYPTNTVSALFLFFLLAIGTSAQAPPPQNENTLSQIVNTHIGQTPLLSAFLKGTATIKEPSGEKSGAITLAAFAQRSSEIDLEIQSEKMRESRVGRGLFPSRVWTGGDGIEHKAMVTDLKLPHPAWFFPSFVLLSGLGSPDYWSSDLGTETWEGKTVRHIAMWQRLPNEQASASTVAKTQTQTDVYLDPITFLPVAMTFHLQTDPQNPGELLLPTSSESGTLLVRVNYSDYRTVQARQIPFHVEMVQGDSRVMDIRISSVALDGRDTTGTN